MADRDNIIVSIMGVHETTTEIRGVDHVLAKSLEVF
jgi:hypothetical protein